MLAANRDCIRLPLSCRDLCLCGLLVTLLASLIPHVSAALDLAVTCPGNLIKNGGFEEPRTDIAYPEKYQGEKKWGVYRSLPGWKSSCLKIARQSKYLELHRNAVETCPEGAQCMPLLLDATGVACQDLVLQKGARYKLSLYYGRIETKLWKGPNQGQFARLNTAAVALLRDSHFTKPSAGTYPGDRQSFTTLITMDTRKQQETWQQYSATFTASSPHITLALTTTMIDPRCDLCGSLVDALCLQKGKQCAVHHMVNDKTK